MHALREIVFSSVEQKTVHFFYRIKGVSDSHTFWILDSKIQQ
jgi:hypothetical protein